MTKFMPGNGRRPLGVTCTSRKGRSWEQLCNQLQPNPRDACRRLLSDCKHYDLLTHLRASACSMLKYGELCDADSVTPDLKTHGPDRNLLDGL